MRRIWILAAIAAVSLGAADAEAGCRGGGRTRFFRVFNRGAPVARYGGGGCGCQAGAGPAAAVSYQAAPAAAGCAFCPQRE